MRFCKDLSEESTMAEINKELAELNASQNEIRNAYATAAVSDPDHVELEKYRQKAIYYMRRKAHYG